ncbi:GNAT family N-acetyltransferase [Marmoricola endophyticus]|uniref:GNAT family N-acetyltransferase n=1 Tax=Marmoricola endophyticus TaxID=2040280 RepID=UPI001E2FF2A4|nr:GNAT family N-acetyltransferase [Marmoricola endophyticus]
MRLRALQEGDWPGVLAIIATVAAEGETYTLDHGIGQAQARAFWSDAAHIVVAVDGDRVLGTAKMGPNRAAQGSHVGTASFMVSPQAQGRGVGRALADHVVEWHRENGFRAICFNAVVATNQAAVRLWQRVGFRVVGTVPGAFRRPNGDYADLHVMYLELVGEP